MTEYLKDLERRQPGDPLPPINLGPYDNPLLWNTLDPYGADRGHQRRPNSVSRNMMELHSVPLVLRDQCVHRWFAWDKCLKNLKPVMFGQLNCHEFEESWVLCRAFETYRLELLKSSYREMTKDYTSEDKKFFPSKLYISFPTYWTTPFSSIIANMRTSGWDEKDPTNMLMNNEPNRVLMRSEWSKTNWERGVDFQGSQQGVQVRPEVVEKELPGFPLPEETTPTARGAAREAAYSQLEEAA